MKKEKDGMRENVEETRTKQKKKTFQTCSTESKNKITQTKKNYVFFRVVSK